MPKSKQHAGGAVLRLKRTFVYARGDSVLPCGLRLEQTELYMISAAIARSSHPDGPAARGCCEPSVGLDPRLDPERIAAVAKTLAEPLRVQIVDVLRRSDEAVCQCELVPLLGITQPLLSHHMRKLAAIGLVEVERRHKWAYYTVNDAALKELTSWLS